MCKCTQISSLSARERARAATLCLNSGARARTRRVLCVNSLSTKLCLRPGVRAKVGGEQTRERAHARSVAVQTLARFQANRALVAVAWRLHAAARRHARRRMFASCVFADAIMLEKLCAMCSALAHARFSVRVQIKMRSLAPTCCHCGAESWWRRVSECPGRDFRNAPTNNRHYNLDWSWVTGYARCQMARFN